MSTPFQSALLAVLTVERSHAALAVKERQWMEIPAVAAAVEASERTLAQAGDRLESEVRRMMREEVRFAVRFETYGADQ